MNIELNLILYILLYIEIQFQFQCNALIAMMCMYTNFVFS